MLDEVGLPRVAAERYPHEFSGGQRQRLGLARSLMLSPELLVADEPVSALDVSIQAQNLNLMQDLQRDLGLAYLFISHDLSVVRYMSDAIGVMYLGKLVEVGQADHVYYRPVHPYTRGLIDTIPVADPALAREREEKGVQGELPSAIDPPSGCRFRTRCPYARDRCAQQRPAGCGRSVPRTWPLATSAQGTRARRQPRQPPPRPNRRGAQVVGTSGCSHPSCVTRSPQGAAARRQGRGAVDQQPADPARFAVGLDALRFAGLEPVVYPSAHDQGTMRHYLAGDDQMRVADLRGALTDPGASPALSSPPGAPALSARWRRWTWMASRRCRRRSWPATPT